MDKQVDYDSINGYFNQPYFYNDKRTGPPYYVNFFIDAGQTSFVPFQDGKCHFVEGPNTCILISNKPDPPRPIKICFENLKQVVDENGTLKQLILLNSKNFKASFSKRKFGKSYYDKNNNLNLTRHKTINYGNNYTGNHEISQLDQCSYCNSINYSTGIITTQLYNPNLSILDSTNESSKNSNFSNPQIQNSNNKPNFDYSSIKLSNIENGDNSFKTNYQLNSNESKKKKNYQNHDTKNINLADINKSDQSNSKNNLTFNQNFDLDIKKKDKLEKVYLDEQNKQKISSKKIQNNNSRFFKDIQLKPKNNFNNSYKKNKTNQQLLDDYYQNNKIKNSSFHELNDKKKQNCNVQNYSNEKYKKEIYKFLDENHLKRSNDYTYKKIDEIKSNKSFDSPVTSNSPISEHYDFSSEESENSLHTNVLTNNLNIKNTNNTFNDLKDKKEKPASLSKKINGSVKSYKSLNQKNLSSTNFTLNNVSYCTNKINSQKLINKESRTDNEKLKLNKKMDKFSCSQEDEKDDGYEGDETDFKIYTSIDDLKENFKNKKAQSPKSESDFKKSQNYSTPNYENKQTDILSISEEDNHKFIEKIQDNKNLIDNLNGNQINRASKNQVNKIKNQLSNVEINKKQLDKVEINKKQLDKVEINKKEIDNADINKNLKIKMNEDNSSNKNDKINKNDKTNKKQIDKVQISKKQNDKNIKNENKVNQNKLNQIKKNDEEINSKKINEADQIKLENESIKDCLNTNELSCLNKEENCLNKLNEQVKSFNLKQNELPIVIAFHLTQSAISHNYVKLKWTQNNGIYFNNLEIIDYQVELSQMKKNDKNNLIKCSRIVQRCINKSCKINNLNQNQEYTFRISLIHENKLYLSNNLTVTTLNNKTKVTSKKKLKKNNENREELKKPENKLNKLLNQNQIKVSIEKDDKTKKSIFKFIESEIELFGKDRFYAIVYLFLFFGFCFLLAIVSYNYIR